MQIGQSLGADVTAVAGRRHAELLARLGARTVLAREDLDLTGRTAGERPAEPGDHDVVLDAVARLDGRAVRSLLVPGGTAVSADPSRGLRSLAGTAWSRGRRVRGVLVRPSGADLAVLAGWSDTGELKPVLSGTCRCSTSPRPIAPARDKTHRARPCLSSTPFSPHNASVQSDSVVPEPFAACVAVHGTRRAFWASSPAPAPTLVWHRWTTPSTWGYWDLGLRTATLDDDFAVGATRQLVDTSSRRSRFTVRQVNPSRRCVVEVALPAAVTA